MKDDAAESREAPPIPSAYKYSWQFDEAMREKRQWSLSQHHRGLRWLTRGILITVLAIVLIQLMARMFGWDIESSIRPWDALALPLAHLLFWSVFGSYVWYVRKKVDPRRLIPRELLCFGCGYSLRGLPVDEQHRGRCPECGREYSLGEYVHPRHPEKYPLDVTTDLPMEGATRDDDGATIN